MLLLVAVLIFYIIVLAIFGFIIRRERSIKPLEPYSKEYIMNDTSSCNIHIKGSNIILKLLYKNNHYEPYNGEATASDGYCGYEALLNELAECYPKVYRDIISKIDMYCKRHYNEYRDFNGIDDNRVKLKFILYRIFIHYKERMFDTPEVISEKEIKEETWIDHPQIIIFALLFGINVDIVFPKKGGRGPLGSLVKNVSKKGKNKALNFANKAKKNAKDQGRKAAKKAQNQGRKALEQAKNQGREAANKAVNKGQEKLNKAKEKAQKVFEQAEEKAVNKGQEKLNKAKEKAQKVFEQAEEKAKNKGQETLEQAQNTTNEVYEKTQVNENSTNKSDTEEEAKKKSQKNLEQAQKSISENATNKVYEKTQVNENGTNKGDTEEEVQVNENAVNKGEAVEEAQVDEKDANEENEIPDILQIVSTVFAVECEQIISAHASTTRESIKRAQDIIDENEYLIKDGTELPRYGDQWKRFAIIEPQGKIVHRLNNDGKMEKVETNTYDPSIETYLYVYKK